MFCFSTLFCGPVLPVSASSSKCLQEGVVKSGVVCLPGASQGLLTWQSIPIKGKQCIRSGVIYKSLSCKNVGNQLKWISVISSQSASEIASTFAATVSQITDNVLENGIKVSKQKLEALWAKNKALGAKLSWFDSSPILDVHRGVYATWADNYRIDIQGQSFCFTHTALQENNFVTIFVPIECIAAQVIDDLKVPISQALYSYRMQNDSAILTSKIAAMESKYQKEGLKIDYSNSIYPNKIDLKVTVLGQRYCLDAWNDGTTSHFKGSC